MAKTNSITNDKKPTNGKSDESGISPLFRDEFALIVLIGSLIIIVVLAAIIIVKSTDNTLGVFNILLPVLASWVGTVLAFYFGRRNFESANQQVRQLVDKITSKQISEEQPVSTIMRGKDNLTAFKIDKTQTIQTTKLSDLLKLFTDKNTRLPIIDADEKPLYMIHKTNIDTYISAGGNSTDSLETFFDNERNKRKLEYGLDKGFVLVSEQTTIGDAKDKMEKTPPCQDILITKEGTQNEPLTGWISNVRLQKYLKV